MITSVHVAKLGPKAAVFRPPKPGSIPGLIQADGGVATRLGTSVIPAFDLTRATLIARWADESALANFEASHKLGQRFAAGWSGRFEPFRATGDWNGVDAALPKLRRPSTEGPLVVVTQSKLNFSRAIPFLKANAAASGSIMRADGLIWGCAFAGPPRFGAITMWESEAAMIEGCYGEDSRGHNDAMAAERTKPFFKESVYVRLRPLSESGSLMGENSIPENVLAI